MKGLLIKDFCLLKQMRNILIIILAMACFLLVSGGTNNMSLIIGYVSIISGLMVSNTIAYDEFDNGYSFLMTLPAGRKTYVAEKYVFSIITGFIGWGFAFLMCLLFVRFKGADMSIKELAEISVPILAVLFIFVDIIIPVRLKFEAEKGKAVFAIIFLIIFSSSFFGAKYLRNIHLGVNKLIAYIINNNIIYVLILLISILFMTISYFISLNVMKKKEL